MALFADMPGRAGQHGGWRSARKPELKLGTYFLRLSRCRDRPGTAGSAAQSRDGLALRLPEGPLAPGKTREDYDARLRPSSTSSSRWASGYFLIVADFINWAKQHGIPVGPAARSGAGSLVAWALGITDLDPLRIYDLLFERFLNPERVSMPDFDIDFCMDRRDEVIDYVARKYGRDRFQPDHHLTAPWRPRRCCATPAACSACPTVSSTTSPN